MRKFTFKKIIPVGYYRSFQTRYSEIKLDKKVVGCIQGGERGEFKIMLHVVKKDIAEDGNLNCLFKNVILKVQFNSEEEAREFLNKNIEKILHKFELYKLED